MIYGAKEVKCPFYKEESKNAIICEGLFSQSLTNNFLTAAEKKKHREKHCCFKYTECEIFKANKKKA